MIRTLIVDDEHWVRQGLLLTLPWEARGFQVVGEADNGETALDMMEKLPVDLLMTDLTMPAMDGFELMRRVRGRYPSVFTVVLTCHQDFHFLQDAMRLGAIDYVVKTNLADENLEEMLVRVADRMQLYQRHPSSLALAAAPIKQSLVLLGTENADEAGVARIEPAGGAVPLGGNSWLIANRARSEIDDLIAELSASPLVGHAGFVRVTDWHARAKPAEWLAALREKLFYDEDAFAEGAWSVSLEELEALRLPRPSETDVRCVRQAWTAMRWVFDAKEFQGLTSMLRTLRLPSRTAIMLFERSAASWAMLAGISEPFRQWREHVARFRTLEDWLRWFGRYRDELAAIAKGFACSGDVFVAILRAIELLQTEDGEHAGRADLAAKVNLSQGYFSTIFKEIVGRSFHDAAKEIRLEKAKKLLLDHADMPIYWIAEKTGFQDEKYFSKIFRVQTGMLPSEYRDKRLR
ncbi:response regulator [Paenibacillus glycinis]|uniref:Response regulator n=1 Tax=Paenibacillus glycinis TaxID=2697035 RepID=A0ABW9XI93_9BACL|nr:response regulator [Paenibacillus glycinis]NBD22335.1 response regulator [Paenibacillus glycinis]